MGSMSESRIRAARDVARALESAKPADVARALEILEPLLGCEISFYDGYASRREGSRDVVVLSANWNAQKLRVSAPEYWRDEPERAMPRIGDVLEGVDGIELEWCDEGSACASCSKWLRTEPDSHFWEPEYRLGDEGFTCLACCAGFADEAAEAA